MQKGSVYGPWKRHCVPEQGTPVGDYYFWPCGSPCTIMDCHNIRKYSLIRKLSNKLITLLCCTAERVPSTYIFVLICIYSCWILLCIKICAVADNLSARSPPPCFSIMYYSNTYLLLLYSTQYYKKMDLMYSLVSISPYIERELHQHSKVVLSSHNWLGFLEVLHWTVCKADPGNKTVPVY